MRKYVIETKDLTKQYGTQKSVAAFVENGLVVSEAHTCEESLEEFFVLLPCLPLLFVVVSQWKYKGLPINC